MKQITITSSVNLGVSDEDYYNSIIDMLSSQKSNIELQDEVCILIIYLVVKYNAEIKILKVSILYHKT